MDLQARIDAYLDENWESVVADINTLVSVESVEDLDGAHDGAPFGEGPRAALDEVLEIARRMGFATQDCNGYIGIADLPGESDTQIGIIGHVDVVSAGPGWTFAPYAVTRKDGYLIGRGVSDDKGPLVVALHAVKFWKDYLAKQEPTAQFPYTVRVLFGANEETNMADVAYYRAHYADPAFLFTPDAEFPVSYGEAGICHGTLRSAQLPAGVLVEFAGGVAPNAVPGTAYAVVRSGGLDLPAADMITVTHLPGDLARIDVVGKSAHASTPELGINAVGVLVDYLLMHNACTYEEQRFLLLQRALFRTIDGSGWGIQTQDQHFGKLTAVGTVASFDQGEIAQTVDIRYPTTTSSEVIAKKVNSLAELIDAQFTIEHDAAPFLMPPDSPAVLALLDAYNEATGEQASAFTMKGGTYARMFPTAASFGPDKPWEGKPAWVGGMHGPDEGISENLLKQAFSIYVRTIGKLMELDL